MNLPSHCCAVLISATLILVGCTVAPDAETYRADCRVRILLPDDPKSPPESSDLVRVAGGQVLNFDVNGRWSDQARTVLGFEQ